MSSEKPQKSQPLPAKEAALLKQTHKLYDSKHYKKAIKTADQVLKKHPNHGETLAFKGLIVSNLPDRRKEAHSLAKAALKADIKSSMCWQVYGMLHRSDRNYEQASKCYAQAFRIDSENLQIARDLAQIQMQTRDIAGLVATAEKTLSIRSNARGHWLLLAVAHTLAENRDTAAQVLGSYMNTLDKTDKPSPTDKAEIGEIELWLASLQRAKGDHQSALKVLNNSKSHIMDRLGKVELQAAIHDDQGNKKEVEQAYRTLIDLIPDNYDYHRGLCQALDVPLTQRATQHLTASLPAGGLAAAPVPHHTANHSAVPSQDVVDKLTEVYADLQEKHPKCDAAKRMPLDFLTGDAFFQAAKARIGQFVQRGVPALFSDLRPLLADAARADALRGAAYELLDEAGADTEAALWLHLFLAQHAAHTQRIGDAIHHICAAEAAPALSDAMTALDVLSAKAEILECAGDSHGAAVAAEHARLLDPKDRYVNSMAVKFWLRAGDVQRAKNTALLFALDFDGKTSNLSEMQVMWYELESAAAHRRTGDLGMVLKFYRSVLDHFAEFEEDQFDFHNYCLRKATMRGYLALLRLADSLQRQPAYVAAAAGSVDAYLALHDEDRPGKAAAEEAAATAGMSEAEAKVWRDKRARATEKRRKAAAAEMDAARIAHKKKRGQSKFDEDPKGEKLLETEQPLQEAFKLAQILREHAPDSLESQRIVFEVARRRQRPFVGLHAAKCAQHLAPDSPEAHRMLVQLTAWLRSSEMLSENAVAQEVLQQELDRLTGGKSCKDLNEAYKQRCGGSSLRACLAVAQSQLLLDPEQCPAAAEHVTGCDLAAVPHTAADAAAAYAWLKDACKDEDASRTFGKHAQQVHRWSEMFDGPERLAAEDAGSLPARLQAMSDGPSENGAQGAAGGAGNSSGSGRDNADASTNGTDAGSSQGDAGTKTYTHAVQPES